MPSENPPEAQVASVEMERILLIAHKMTIADSAKRRILFELTKAPVQALLQINERRYGASEVRRQSIAGLAKSLLELRNLQEGLIEVDQSDGLGECPHCQSTIERFQRTEPPHPNEPWLSYCPVCCQDYMQALKRLAREDDGFGIQWDDES